MADYLTRQDLINGSADAKTLGEFANGAVGMPNHNRVGNDVSNLATIKSQALEAASAAANLKTYLTRAVMLADTAQPVPTTGRVTNDATLANNGDYVWNGSSWVWSAIQTASATQLKVVVDSVDFLENTTRSFSRVVISANLLDLSRIAADSGISNVDGSLYSLGGTFASDFMPVSPGITYRSSYSGRIAFYNAARSFISIVQASATATAPANAAFARATFATSGQSTAMFAESANYPAEYQPYQEEVVIPDIVLDPASVTASIVDLAATQTSFIKRSSIQLFNKDTVISGKRVNQVNGILLDYALGVASDWIPVAPETAYVQTEGNTFAEYDAERKFVRGYGTGVTAFTTSASTRFVRVTVRSVILANYMLVQGSALPSVYQSYDGYSLDGSIVPPSVLTSRWAGKKWNVLGDSITADAASYWRTIASNCRFSVARNYGVGGTSIAYRDAPSGAPDPALYTQKWMANRYMEMDNDADLITVAGGTNDFLQVPLGSFSVRDNATVFGACRTISEGLVAKYPTKSIGAILPFHRYNSVVAFNPYTFMALRDAMLEVFDFYGIPAFDSTRHLPVRFWNEANANAWSRNSSSTGLPDGLHPNEECHAIIAPIIQAWILNL